MDKQAKVALGEKFSEKLAKANAAVVAEYRGMTVSEITDLRRVLKAADASFNVVKNRIVKKAIEAKLVDMKELSPKLKGPVGVLCFYGDPAKGAKAVLDFQKDHPNFVVTGGVLEAKSLSAKDLKVLSELPSKDELIAKILGSLTNPHRQLVTVLSGVTRSLVQVIAAVRDKKSA